VPPTLDWDLWQGPAPRRPYKDNVQPYNWHWFRYGAPAKPSTTARTKSTSAAGRWASTIQSRGRHRRRYHYKDDWQFYDTLVTNYEYDGTLISWDCRCCNGMKIDNRDRGSTIMGTNGSVWSIATATRYTTWAATRPMNSARRRRRLRPPIWSAATR